MAIKKCKFCGADPVRKKYDVFEWYECPRCHRRSKMSAFFENTLDINETIRMINSWNNMN